MRKKQDEDKQLEIMRHSCEHVLTQAMIKLWPGQIIAAMGPATDQGFYFDFDTKGDLKISEADFPKIEAEMKKIIKKDFLFRKEKIPVKKAQKLFAGNSYKQEWLAEIQEKGQGSIVFWTGDKFVDLCTGPHLKSTGEIEAFKLLSVAGAYWRGSEKNKMLTRIYGTCFPTHKELDEYLNKLEEAKKRDHRKIGKQLDWFSFHPAAPADIFWHHKGWIIMREMYQYWREVHQRKNYQEVRTPEILTRKTWDQSGHTSFFLEKMYRVLSPEAKEWDLAIKPMNCDGGILIYKSKPRSYKDFPLKMGELGVVHRYEASGETLGILRPREFTQDDAHIYCTPDQVKDELKKVIDLCFEVYDTFGLKLDHLELSTRPEKSIGSDEIWERAENIMRQVLKETKIPHQINEGEGAFYGPKFDFHLNDSLDRTWQCATIQLDFAQPENFELEYTTAKGTKERPVMIHRVLYGSVERFLGIIIEDCAGNLPIWLTPVQARILPITEKQVKYSQEVLAQLKKEGIRAEMDESSQTLSYKIRGGQLEKIPFLLIIGEKEVEAKQVAVRQRDGQDLGGKSLPWFIKKAKELIKSKSLGLVNS
ncbi:threonine--tRNA ligase [Candidatus Shapirobacteria bacterium]|nr:threonine--tRNA ligase [Candidatus Shapirobacteria bacterium]